MSPLVRERQVVGPQHRCTYIGLMIRPLGASWAVLLLQESHQGFVDTFNYLVTFMEEIRDTYKETCHF